MIRAASAGCGALLLAIAMAGCGGGNDWTTRDVPEEYPTIQAAVDAAQPGDLVIIAAFVTLTEAEAEQHLPKLIYVDAANHIARTNTSIPKQMAVA